MTTQRAQPPKDLLLSGLAPRGLSRTQAAHYCGIGATLFDRAVRDGQLPKPFSLYGRKLWCRRALDDALDLLRDAAAEEAEAAPNSWADFQ